eukprot:GHVS01083685.1.p1 GENE.GHVS01083685.1~~GHVS01083685.1.p1  ORF type:complete len:625 (-),score=108.12 GHVS01083685.1:451-2325(-)
MLTYLAAAPFLLLLSQLLCSPALSMEAAQGPSPHKRSTITPAVLQNTFRFFGLGGYTSRIILGKRKEKALAVPSVKKSVSLGAHQRELGVQREVGVVKRATTETLPMFEKNLVYHKHEAVHSADMFGMGGEAEFNEEEDSNVNNKEVLGIHDVFPLLSDRDAVGGTEFSPASSSSSPSFNASEMMALAGIRISGGPLRLEHHRHEEKFEATREVGEKVNAALVKPSFASLPPTTDSSTASENLAIPTTPVLPMTGGLITPKATFPLEGPPSSPVPPIVVAPSIIDSPPITPDSSSTKQHHKHSRPISPISPGRLQFLMSPPHALGGGSPLHTIITNVRGAVISRKQRRKKAMNERKQNMQMLRQQRRRERDEKRDEIRKERERRKHRHNTHRLPIDEQTEEDRKAHGLFDWPSWFEEPADDVSLIDVVTAKDMPVGPLSLFWPMDEALYRMDFTAGDISESLWDQCITDPRGMQGSWQVQLARSDSISPILEGLGVGRMKRSIVAAYPSVVKMSVLSSEPSHQPTIHMVTHLPMGITKQATIDFNGEEVTQADGDTGAWQTVPYFVRGRAMQRRVNSRGVMFDVRCALPSDPAGVIPGKVMLFQWTFIPHGKAPLVARRWLQLA